MKCRTSSLVTALVSAGLPLAGVAEQTRDASGIEQAKQREIVGSGDAASDQRVQRFPELVVLPAGVVMGIVYLLRGRPLS